MAKAKYTGTGLIASGDYHEVTFKGFTKAGKYIQITILNAVNLGNIDLASVEKGETVPQIVFTSTYTNTDALANSTDEPFEIECEDDTLTGSKAIMLGAGVISIDKKEIGLTRGGSQFVVERTIREINADGDRGPVKDRLTIDRSVPKMTINVLEVINHIAELYPALKKTTVS